MHNKHSTVGQAVVSFCHYMPKAWSGYVFSAVSLRQFVHSSGLRARLWLSHDAEVIFDGHPDDVRTIWQLEQGLLLLREREFSSKFPSFLLGSFSSLSFLFKVLFTSLCFLCLPISLLNFGARFCHLIGFSSETYHKRQRYVRYYHLSVFSHSYQARRENSA